MSIKPKSTTIELDQKGWSETSGGKSVAYQRSVSKYNLLTLTWENMNAVAPDQKSSLFKKIFKRKESNLERRNIIQDVNGIAKPGEVMAIMGASGAGKTTLLNSITFRNTGNLKVTGDVKVNGLVIKNSAELAAISGYIQQNDLFIGTLKVKEHLTFTAMLRMGKKVKESEKISRVEEVMNDLNLKKCEDTLIGIPAQGIKGISGGEMRRLAFASEVITNPPILFADEPTSGLDSFMALSIVESMNNLAAQGKTIVCTIHQPSSEIFELFDSVYLMAEGRLAYTGSLVSTPDFFKSQGFVCPVNYNPADFYIQTLAISPNDRDGCKEKVKKICNGFESSRHHQELKASIDKSNNSHLDSSIDNQLKIDSSETYKSSVWTQFKWLMWRSTLSTLRSPLETTITIAQTIIVGLMFGLIYLQLDQTSENVQNINAVLFLLVVNSVFANVNSVINTFPAEIPIFLREHQNGMYRVFLYYISKILVETPKFIIGPFLFVTIVYWMVGLDADAGKFFICALSIILVANCSVAFGSFVSCAVPSVNAALALIGPILVPLMIFGGFFLSNSAIPDYFIWIKYISWIYYGNEIVVVNQWNGIGNVTCGSDANPAICNPTTGQLIIDSFEYDYDNIGRNFGLICTLFVVFRALSYLILVLKATFKK